MNRLLPSPALSIGLYALWILLMQSVDPGTLVLGGGLSLLIPVLTAGLNPSPMRIRHPLRLLRLFSRVAVEMVRSNAEVAVALLTRSPRDLKSGFVHIPLDLKDARGLAILAMIITLTPGTAWAQLSPDRKSLLLHVLAIEDEASLVRLIKQRYERTLLEVFS